MVSCSITGCMNKTLNTTKGVTFHTFPKDRAIKPQWIRAVGHETDWIPTKHHYICSKHFTPDRFYETDRGLRRLRYDAVPTLFLESSCTSVVPKLEPMETGLFEHVNIPDPITDDDSPRMRKLKSEIMRLRELCEDRKRTIKRLNQTKRRNADQIFHLKSLTDSSKKKKKLADDTMLDNISNLSTYIKTENIDSTEMSLQSIKYENGKLEILDQLLLPTESKYVPVTSVADGWNVINKMQVRGAPAIAIVGCLSLVVDLNKNESINNKGDLFEFIKFKLDYLVSARPTAVNMRLAADELLDLAWKLDANMDISYTDMRSKIVCEIESMLVKDIADNKAIGRFGAKAILNNITDGDSVRILTHCNTGSLATAGYGTALGVIRSLHTFNKLEHVYCTETRPYNQGARLTAYELVYEQIPATLIVDSMVAAAMKTKNISAVVVGADRVASNGDTANKIGTYQIAVLAKHHGVPFYVCAPFTSIDMDMKDGNRIVIEQRPEKEMTCIGEYRIAAPGIACWNPAFDVTPASLITGIITEKGCFLPSELIKKK